EAAAAARIDRVFLWRLLRRHGLQNPSKEAGAHPESLADAGPLCFTGGIQVWGADLELRHGSFSDGPMVMIVGTMKGAFLGGSSAAGKRWEWGVPYSPGHPVYAVAFDGREGRRRVLAAPQSMHFGSLIRYSDDFGRTWANPETANVRFPEGTDSTLKG